MREFVKRHKIHPVMGIVTAAELQKAFELSDAEIQTMQHSQVFRISPQ